MPLQIPEGMAQMTFTHILAGSTQTAQVTFGVNFVDVLAFETVADSWRDNIMPVISNGWTFSNAHARVMEGAVWEQAYSTAGGISDPATPPNVSFLIRKITAIPGRKNKGRMYLPGVPEGWVDGTGIVAATIPPIINPALATFLADIAGAPPGGFGLMVILHDEPLPVTSPTNVEQLLLQPMVATQRRRLRG